jgi:AmmeMemoRadiSam system protein A
MDNKQRSQLLQLARDTMRAHFEGKSLPDTKSYDITETPFGGAFVTIRNHGRLRGCIGRFNPEATLAETIQRMSLATLSDPRFLNAPVTAEELDQLTIEISVLSAMKRVDDPLSLEVGVHGIFIRKGPRSGCFLPQVATEQKWDKLQFLSACCAGKAGLAPNAWQDPDTEVYLFSADVISEDE